MGIKKEGCAAALGTFDGLHIGHKALIDTLKKNADGRITMVCTFSNLPVVFFGSEAKQLFTPMEKSRAVSKEGIDVLFMREFDGTFAETPKEEFINELTNKLGCTLIVVGFNYRFGKGGEGDAQYLKEEAAKRGVKVIVVPEVDIDGSPVNSTTIRKLIAEGDVKSAAKLLGRDYSVEGEVIYGKQLGRTLGYPTANISVDPIKCLPGNGVYAVYAYYEGIKYPAMTNIGRRPTVDSEGDISIETYIDGFSGDMYGKKLRLEFVEKIRDERKMAGIDELKMQLAKDIKTVKNILQKA